MHWITIIKKNKEKKEMSADKSAAYTGSISFTYAPENYYLGTRTQAAFY